MATSPSDMAAPPHLFFNNIWTISRVITGFQGITEIFPRVACLPFLISGITIWPLAAILRLLTYWYIQLYTDEILVDSLCLPSQWIQWYSIVKSDGCQSTTSAMSAKDAELETIVISDVSERRESEGPSTVCWHDDKHCRRWDLWQLLTAWRKLWHAIHWQTSRMHGTVERPIDTSKKHWCFDFFTAWR